MSAPAQLGPLTIVGAGRIGTALAQLAAATHPGIAPIRRGEPLAARAAASGPIYVCTRNDDLQGVVDATPTSRRADLVFVQNGMLRTWLEAQGLQDSTQALLYFAVSKVGAVPVDGGGSVVRGRWAAQLCTLLQSGGISCAQVSDTRYGQVSIEKLLWNCIFGLLCAHRSCTVGQVVAQHRADVAALVAELAPIAQTAMGCELDPGVVDRLCAYSMDIADYRGAVKELPWRNGWFIDRGANRLHRTLLGDLGQG